MGTEKWPAMWWKEKETEEGKGHDRQEKLLMRSCDLWPENRQVACTHRKKDSSREKERC